MLLLNEVPKYECLLEGAKRYPSLAPSAVEAFLHLLRTSTDLTAAFDAVHASHQLSSGRFFVLLLLHRAERGPVTPADLAERAGVTRATITGLLDTLERDGLVRREDTPADRRMMHVRLTAAGQGYIERVLPDYFRRISMAMSLLSEAEHHTLVRLVDKIAAAIPAIGADLLPWVASHAEPHG